MRHQGLTRQRRRQRSGNGCCPSVSSVRGGDFQRPRQAALRLEPVVSLQMQLKKGQVRVADDGRFSHPGQRAVDGQAFVEQVPANMSAQQRVAGQRQDAVLQGVDHVAPIVFSSASRMAA